MTSINDHGLPQQVPASSAFARCGRQTDLSASALWLALAVFGVCVVFVIVLDFRFPYIHQLPIFDLDYITSVTIMWARNWWIEGPWHMMFSLPYAPLSVETATPELRHGMYQSWPPGAVLSLYLVALATNTEPNITMVNWLNVAGHGLIALYLALAAYVIAGILRRPNIDRAVLAILAACLVLFPRGAVYFFSQVYTFDTHIVVFYALFLLIAALEVGARSEASARRRYIALLTVLIAGLYVDWLFYVVYAVWFVLRWLGSRWGYGRKMGKAETAGLISLPLLTFGIFLWWRMKTPGSIAAEAGVLESLKALAWKFVFRLGDTDDHPVSFGGFFGAFYDQHQATLWDDAPMLMLTAFVACVVLFAILFVRSRNDLPRRRLDFGLLSVFVLSIVPAYLQMIIFKQHTFIHPWSTAKMVVPLAMVAGVFPPLLVLAAFDPWREMAGQSLPRASVLRTAWRAVGSLCVLAFAVWLGAQAWPNRATYLIGRIEPDNVTPWLTVHTNTNFNDVVVSPDYEGTGLSMYAAQAGKLVYKLTTFKEVDGIVGHICVPFNVVVMRKGQDAPDTFDGRTADRVIRAGGISLLYFQNYQAAAKTCS